MTDTITEAAKLAACDHGVPQTACLAAGEHICGTKFAFTLPVDNRKPFCPGCTSNRMSVEQYCKRHASKVTLEEVRASGPWERAEWD